MSKRLLILAVIVILMAGLVLAACSPASGENAAKLAPVSDLPPAMQEAPQRVRLVYQFAAANPEALENVPCYCGCGAIGHHSNLACFVKEYGPDGKPVFDDHAMGCSICVDIAQDVMRMTGEGQDPAAIRSEIVAAYSKFGPSNQ